MRHALIGEVLTMAWDSLRSHKLRSLLTVLGIVIGITMVVGMSSLILGFDQMITSQFQSLGPDTLFLVKFSIQSLSAGEEFRKLLARPDITEADAEAIAEAADTIEGVSIMYGGSFPPSFTRASYRGRHTSDLQVIGVGPAFIDAGDIELDQGRFLSSVDLKQRSDVAILGHGPAQALFPLMDPIGRRIRVKGREYRVIGTLEQRQAASIAGDQADALVLVPATNYRKLYGPRSANAMVIMRARTGVPVEEMRLDVEGVMRARHGLRADEPADFDLLSQESLLEIWRQLTTAFFLTLVSLSSVALVVGGVGVMAIMLVSVTERTREIGVRKALGARRRDILLQFLAEATALAAVGGLLGVAIGAAIGWLVHALTGFPVALPWWSFALAVGSSSLIGIGFGIYPANRAARLDPVDALRHE